ncbi:AraC family transcriptional regulator [uncultured Tateyamaria sp.]|uniref:helix-turn-helix domain-containing protein n=1 Tax=uncultured Tateyamaria sp. TaxID=455651 RepID=UPI0026158D48|nr:AraC family transcriptional regulator [uncultured Tateyamaria sp.]
MRGLITRQVMADEMAKELAASVTERVGHNWKRSNAMVADQGSGAATFHSFDFHIVELYRSGSHRAKARGEFLQGDSWEGTYLPGSISYLQPDTRFDLECEGDAQIQQVYLDRAVFSDVASAMFEGDMDTLASRAFQGHFHAGLKSFAELLLDEARRPNIGTEIHADLIVQQMAILILRHQNMERLKLPIAHRLSHEQLGHVISYLEDQIEDIGGMDTLAKLIDMDVYSFTKAFKATTGQSPGQFLIERRIARAKDLLLNTNDTLADITYATGFSNQPHMTSTFTKHVGISPGKWRKAVRA